MARCFLAHLRAHLPGIQVPAPGMIPSGVRPTSHIYSEAQIAALMREASALKPTGSLRPHTYATLIGLLASCGLRPGEAVRLCDADVEMEATPPRLVIRETKFRKSRLVPVDSSTADALRSYASTRKRLGYDGLSQTFFVSESGAPLAYSTVGATFLDIVRRLGIHGMASSHGPNLRCLRHTFAVRRLLNWYSQGMDVNKLLPQLSVYLGHAKPQNTYWYLTATPELLRKAGSRFESYADQRPEL
jgi:integrase